VVRCGTRVGFVIGSFNSHLGFLSRSSLNLRNILVNTVPAFRRVTNVIRIISKSHTSILVCNILKLLISLRLRSSPVVPDLRLACSPSRRQSRP